MLDSINVKYWELAHTSEELGYHRENDYACRCDICGDSKRSRSVKRLHLYKKTSYENDSIACFNCSYTGNMYSYLRDFHPSLFNAYKQEMSSMKLSNLILSEKSLEIRAEVKNNSLFTFDRPNNLIKVTDHADALAYVTNRGFPDLRCLVATGNVDLCNGKSVNLKDYIIIPLLENGKWYGFYSRSIRDKTFYTFIPEQNTGWKVWNWFKINKEAPVYVFEAIFNAMSSGLPNSIACLGSDIDSERLKDLKNPIFCFDNDEAGRTKAMKYVKKGYKVSILPKDIKDDHNDLFAKKGWSKDQIAQIIEDNVVSGLKAELLLKL